MLYKQVLDKVLDDLASGVLQVGDRLPTEINYANELGVSRSTVRLAFKHLEESGIIKRRQRGGTEIISAKAVQRYTMSKDSNVVNVIFDSRFDITDVRMVNAADFPILERFTSASDRWLLCEGTRSRSDESFPFNWSQVFVAEKFSDISLQVSDNPRSIHELVEKKYGCAVSRVKKGYSAASCSAKIAHILGLHDSDSVTTGLAELYNINGELMQLVNSIYDPARFELVSDVVDTKSDKS